MDFWLSQKGGLFTTKYVATSSSFLTFFLLCFVRPFPESPASSCPRRLPIDVDRGLPVQK